MNKTLLFLAGALILSPPVLVNANEPQWARRVGVQTAIFERLLQRQISLDWLSWQNRSDSERHRRFQVTNCLVSAPYNGKQAAISPIVFQRLRSRRVGKCLIVGQEKWLRVAKGPNGDYLYIHPSNRPTNVHVQLSHLRFISSTDARAYTSIYWGAEPNSGGEGSAEWHTIKLKRSKKGWQVTSFKITGAAG